MCHTLSGTAHSRVGTVTLKDSNDEECRRLESHRGCGGGVFHGFVRYLFDVTLTVPTRDVPMIDPRQTDRPGKTRAFPTRVEVGSRVGGPRTGV